MAFAGVPLHGWVEVVTVDDNENRRVSKLPFGEAILAELATGSIALAKAMLLALCEAYDNCSDGAVEMGRMHIWFTDTAIDTTTDVLEGDLGFVDHKAVLRFQRTDGKEWETAVYAPKNNPAGGSNIFDDDPRVVDEADTNVAALIAALIDKVTFPGVGTASITLAEYIGGYFEGGAIIPTPRKGIQLGGHED